MDGPYQNFERPDDYMGGRTYDIIQMDADLTKKKKKREDKRKSTSSLLLMPIDHKVIFQFPTVVTQR